LLNSGAAELQHLFAYQLSLAWCKCLPLHITSSNHSQSFSRQHNPFINYHAISTGVNARQYRYL